MYQVKHKTTGTIIDRFPTKEQAEAAAKSCEACDVMNGEWDGAYCVEEVNA